MSTPAIITHDKCGAFEAEIEALKTENRELKEALMVAKGALTKNAFVDGAPIVGVSRNKAVVNFEKSARRSRIALSKISKAQS